MAVVRHDGSVARVNDALCDSLRRAATHLSSASLYDLAHPDDVAMLRSSLEEVAQGRRAHTRHDLRLLTPDGATLWFDLALGGYRRAGGHVQLLAVFVDITARKRQERVASLANGASNLTSKPGPLSQLAQDLSALFVPKLADGCVVELSALAGGPLVRATHTDRFAEGLVRDIHEALQRRPRELQLQSFLLTARDAQREAGPLGLTNGVVCAPILVGEEDFGRLTLVCTDPKRCFTEDDLALTQAAAQALADGLARRARESTALLAVKHRDEFLSIAAHELRTPLTPLFLALQQLRRPNATRTLNEGTLRLLLERATRQTEHLARLVDDLLDVARISSGPLRLRREPVNLTQLVKEVLERMSASIERAGCPLHASLDAGVTGEWDKGRIEQVLTNLIDNALKYGAGQPIWVEVLREDTTAVFIVHDRGVGVPEERLEHIFDRFARAETAERFEGLGLGLYIAKQIVTAHGGEIAVLSQLGRGSTFTVRLPALDVSHDPFASQNGHVVQST